MDYKEAIAKVVQELREDKMLYYAFQANIAMCFMDTFDEELHSDIASSYRTRHELANEAAQRFLNLLISNTKEVG